MQNPVHTATAQDRQVYLRDAEDAIAQIIQIKHIRKAQTLHAGLMFETHQPAGLMVEPSMLVSTLRL